MNVSVPDCVPVIVNGCVVVFLLAYHTRTHYFMGWTTPYNHATLVPHTAAND